MHILFLIKIMHSLTICIIRALNVMSCSGTFLAVVAGVLYGTSFVPVLYIKNHADDPKSQYNGASQFGKSRLPHE